MEEVSSGSSHVTFLYPLSTHPFTLALEDGKWDLKDPGKTRLSVFGINKL